MRLELFGGFGQLMVYVEKHVLEARVHVVHLHRELFHNPLLIVFDFISVKVVQRWV